VAALVPLAERVQVFEGGAKIPDPLAKMVAVPIGLVAAVKEVSVTVTVQVVTVPTVTDEGVQLTAVVVGWMEGMTS